MHHPDTGIQGQQKVKYREEEGTVQQEDSLHSGFTKGVLEVVLTTFFVNQTSADGL